MKSFIIYITGIFKGLWSLIIGMSVTGKYFISPWKIVTQKYPENRKKLTMFDRFKGELFMPHDANNQHRCTGCGICEINCPNGSIEVITDKILSDDGKSKRIIDKHIYHLSMCTFCGLCVKSCPSNAIIFSQKFEHAVYNRSKLTKVLNKPGSSLAKEI